MFGNQAIEMRKLGQASSLFGEASVKKYNQGFDN
jgi:hypothetical protein